MRGKIKFFRCNTTTKALTIAITGIPGSGKSTVLNEFSSAGFIVIDSDELSRQEFYKKKNLSAIKKIFNSTDRKIIAQKIFNNTSLRRKLEQIIHPGVIRALKLHIKKAAREKKFFAAEVPLLFEKNLEKLFDFIIVVSCPERLAIRHLMNKKGLPPSLAKLMIKSHFPSYEKSRKADFVLQNKKDITSLRRRAKALANELLARWRNICQAEN